MDYPGGRKQHHAPVPLAGAAPLAGAVGGILVLGGGLITPAVMTAVIGALALALMGIIDDRRPLPALGRLGGQIVAALPLALVLDSHVLALPWLGRLELGLMAPLVWMVWIVAIVNALNFLDGLDGLAVGVLAIVGVGLGVVALVDGRTTGAVMLLSVGGAALGFAAWNLPPARAFLGDGGIMGLGFLLAAGSLIGMTKGAASVSLALPVIALALPLADASSVIGHRLRARQAPWQGDRGHLHHRLLDRGWSARRILAALWGLTGLFVLEALILALAVTRPALIPVALGGAVIVVVCFLVLHRREKAPPRMGSF